MRTRSSREDISLLFLIRKCKLGVQKQRNLHFTHVLYVFKCFLATKPTFYTVVVSLSKFLYGFLQRNLHFTLVFFAGFYIVFANETYILHRLFQVLYTVLGNKTYILHMFFHAFTGLRSLGGGWRQVLTVLPPSLGSRR